MYNIKCLRLKYKGQNFKQKYITYKDIVGVLTWGLFDLSLLTNSFRNLSFSPSCVQIKKEVISNLKGENQFLSTDISESV